MLRLAVPLATILFCWITARTQVDFVDGPAVSLYGFPVPWHRWSAAASMQYLVDLSAFATDYLLYVLLCAAVLRSAPAKRVLPWIGPSAQLLLWAAALVSTGWLILNLVGDLELGPLATSPHRVTGVAVHLGVGYPY